MSGQNGGSFDMGKFLHELEGDTRKDGRSFLPDIFGEVWTHPQSFDEVWAEIWNQLKEIELKGVMVLRDKITPGHDNFRGSKLVSKRPVRRGWLEVPEKYELTLSMDMDGRELLEHKELTYGVYLLKFDGYSGPYYAIGLAPDWNPDYRMPTLNFSYMHVAVSDQMPEKNGEYQCTVIKKRNDNATSLEKEMFEVTSNVKVLGVNSALCELKNGKLLLVTWHCQKK